MKTKGRKNKNHKLRNGAARWIALSAVGTVMAYAGTGNVLPVHAYGPAGRFQAAYAPNVTQDFPVHHFEIPSGTLAGSIEAFQTISGMHLTLSRDGIGNLVSPGVKGDYSDEKALSLMLAGTGVSFRYTGSRALTLEVIGPVESLDVTTSASTLSLTSPKFSGPLRDAPQSITVISQAVMEAQGAMTLRDTLRNVAGISLAAGEGGAQGDNLTIRGFTARSDIFNDGMRDFGSYYRDPFNLEQAEVLRGPSSVTFGRGTTGGVVNQATKAPQRSSFVAGAVDFGSDLTRRFTADVNEALPRLGTGAAFRLNLMGHDSRVAGRDIAENRRFGYAPSLAFGLGTATRLTFNYFHQSANDTPDYGILWLFNGPAPVARHNYYGFQEGNFLRTNVDMTTMKAEHDLSRTLSLRNQTRYAYYTRDVQITEPRIAGTPTLTTALSDMTVTRNQLAAYSVETFFENQFDVTARFRTGFIRHTLVSGIEAGREISDPTRPTFTGVPTTSLLNPDTSQFFSGTATITSQVHTRGISLGAYAIDTMKLGNSVEISGGGRWDRFDANYSQSIAPASAFQRTDDMPSWRGAFVYKPRAIGSIYFDYGTSFNPSAESLSLSTSTANTAPEKNRTYEAGSKWDLSAEKLSVRTALFRTDKTNAREPDPANPLQNVLSGSQRVQGFELEASGRLNSRWQILAAYALMQSRLVKSQYYPAAVGSQLANVPRNTFSLWTNYSLPWRLEVGGGGQFVDSRTASSTVPLDPTTGLVKQVPGYWAFNAMARYPLMERVDLRINVNNLTDKYFYDQIHPGHIVPGAARALLLGLNFRY